ncbi:carboxymuconolactone decarboxylase family protein [Oxalobacteraceae bacterium OM1]|nr:carboxymuconolactone decarboxylase family protein [Oxalobacteraceae bacterium OM1]
MPRLHSIPAADATGKAAELFSAIKARTGMVPNAYRDIGVNSPIALETMLGVDAALRKSTLSAKDIEVIKLAVSEAAGCDYCVAAHTLVGKGVGLSTEALAAARHHGASGDTRLDALAAFAHHLASSRGTVASERIAEVKAAGISDAEIVDTLLAISSITFTNLFNRVNDTTLDFPPVK